MHSTLIGRLAATMLGVAVATVAVSRELSAQDAQGQRSGSSSNPSFANTADARDLTTGLTIGMYSAAATGISLSGPAVDGVFKTKFGEGAGLVAGWGFNPAFSAYASLDLVKQATAPHSLPRGTYGLSHLEIGGRANIRTGGARTLPYLTASIGNRALSARVTDEEFGDTTDFTLSGLVYVLGGGVQRSLSPHLAIDAGVAFATGKFDHRHDDFHNYNDLQVNRSSSLRLRIGVNWRP